MVVSHRRKPSTLEKDQRMARKSKTNLTQIKTKRPPKGYMLKKAHADMKKIRKQSRGGR